MSKLRVKFIYHKLWRKGKNIMATKWAVVEGGHHLKLPEADHCIETMESIAEAVAELERLKKEYEFPTQ